MGADRAGDSASQAGREQAHRERAIGGQRGDVYLEHGVPVGAVARTVNGYLKRWEHDGTLARIHHALYVKCREMADRQASPTVGIIDRWGVAARRPV